ncbi:mechanosensitive ion channel family protein [Streptococcus dentiloxodontae]
MTFIEKYINQFNPEQILMDLVSKGISLLLLLFVFLLSKKLIDLICKYTIEKSLAWTRQSPARQKTISRLIHNILSYALYFFLMYWLLSIIGVPISSLIAGAGLAGLALGLGAQGFLSDVVNGIFILLENQFEVGDSVEIGAVSGNVSSVGIRTTQVRGFDGTLHFIPNRNITIVSNKSRGDMRAQINIPIFAHTNIEELNQIIKDVNEENVPNYPEIIGSPNILGLKTNPSGQLVFRIDIFTQNSQQDKIYSIFFRLYQTAILSHGITLPTLLPSASSPTVSKPTLGK